MNPFSTSAVAELAEALQAVGEPEEDTSPEAVRAAELVEEHRDKQRALVAQMGKDNPQGKRVVRIPPGAVLKMLERDFVVVHVSRTAIALNVSTCPEGLTTGRALKIFGGGFTVGKITLPLTSKQAVRVMLLPDKRTKINPKPIRRHG